MYFETTPSDFTPISSGLPFDFCCEQTCDIEAVIINDLSRAEVARLQVKNVYSGTIDIAPYIPKPNALTPVNVGKSRFQNIATGLYHVELYRQGETTPQCSSSSVRVSSNDYLSDEMPFLTTTLAKERTISTGEYDNIAVYSYVGAEISARITTDAGDDVTLTNTAITGVSHLIFATQYLSAEATTATIEICCDDEYVEQFSYTLLPKRTTGMRIAWRTTTGSIEHYTFPVATHLSVAASRNLTLTKNNVEKVLDGSLVKQQHLISDFEPRSTLSALSEILAASEVWCISPGQYRTRVVDVALKCSLFNEPGHIEIDVVTDRKEACV